jgi:hypothetical protein
LAICACRVNGSPRTEASPDGSGIQVHKEQLQSSSNSHAVFSASVNGYLLLAG